jgi:hypothetical protein
LNMPAAKSSLRHRGERPGSVWRVGRQSETKRETGISQQILQRFHNG